MTMKGGWNCALTIPGALFVMMPGIIMMLAQFVPNLATHQKVGKRNSTRSQVHDD